MQFLACQKQLGRNTMKKSNSLPGSPDIIKEFNRPGGRYIPAWIKGNNIDEGNSKEKTKVKQRRNSKKTAKRVSEKTGVKSG